MTIQEYDAKYPIRKKLEQIDRALETLERSSQENDSHIMSMTKFRGIGTISWLGGTIITNEVEDEIITQRFKALLIERKQELLNEFTKNSSDK